MSNSHTPRWLIEHGLSGCRAAALDADGFPVALSHYRDPSIMPEGGLYWGRVTGFDRASDMAFLDLGAGLVGVMNLRRAKALVSGRVDAISDCLTEGQYLRVQVVSDTAEQGKALAVTPRPRLVGRYALLELTPTGTEPRPRVNISKDMPPQKTDRLRTLLLPLAADCGQTVILRTLAVLADDDAILAEASQLAAVAALTRDTPGLIWAPTPLTAALIDAPMDHAVTIGGVALDQAAISAEITANYPDLAETLSFAGADLFEAEEINEAIDMALADRLDLPSGGWVSFHETPALTAVDVNMGYAFKGRIAAEAKRLVNMEAALAIMHQLRFQNIGGLIVVDFIDMTGRGAVADLMAVVDEAIAEDNLPTSRTNLSQFGMMELSRPRRGLSLRARLQQQRAPVPAVGEQVLELIDRACMLGLGAAPGSLVLALSQPAADWLSARGDLINLLADKTHRSVRVDIADGSDCYLEV